MITLLLVDDQTLVRGALSALLTLEDDLTVVGEAGDGETALTEAKRLQPDVCLMDIQMPGLDGIAATREMTQAHPETRVLIVTTFARPGYVQAALDAGASGFIVKDAPPAQLADAIRRVHAGLQVIDPELAQHTLLAGANPLTEREQEILRLAGEGRTTQQIARQVFLSAGTVRNYLSQAIGKTGSSHRAEAARTAREHGWI